MQRWTSLDRIEYSALSLIRRATSISSAAAGPASRNRLFRIVGHRNFGRRRTDRYLGGRSHSGSRDCRILGDERVRTHHGSGSSQGRHTSIHIEAGCQPSRRQPQFGGARVRWRLASSEAAPIESHNLDRAVLPVPPVPDRHRDVYDRGDLGGDPAEFDLRSRVHMDQRRNSMGILDIRSVPGRMVPPIDRSARAVDFAACDERGCISLGQAGACDARTPWLLR